MALAAPENWAWFWRFNGGRSAENSVWEVLRVKDPAVLNALAAAMLLAAAGAAAACAWRAAPASRVRAVRLGTALVLVAWVASNKVWSPQYALYAFAAGALVAGPRWLFVALAAISVVDYHLAFEVRAERGIFWFFDGWYYAEELLRTAIYAAFAAWLVARAACDARRARGDGQRGGGRPGGGGLNGKGNGRRWAWWAVFAVIPVLVVAFHWIAARPGMAFSGSDLRYFFYGVREAVAGALRHGELPWWQRGFHLGYPLVADPQAAVFAPTTWLTLPWDAPRALTLATLLHLTIAAWGMAAWMRLRGLSPASGLLAAVLFALGAKQTVHVIHWNFAATTAFWPWMLAGLEGFATTRRSRFLLLTAVATALCWLGGSPQMAHFGSLVAGLYALRIAADLWPGRRADAVWAVVVVPIGFVMASVLVLPALELSRMGPRSMVVDYAFVTSWKWPDAWGLALFVLPRAYGDGRWGLNLWEATGYVGVPALALAVAAPLRRRGVVLFAVLAVLGAWLSLGDRAPLGLHWLLYKFLPGYGSFRVPTRGLLVTAFAMALLSAEGLEALRRDPTRGRLSRSLGVFVAVALLALSLPRLPGWPFDPVWTRKTAWFAVMISGLGALWVIAAWRGLRGSLAGAAMVALAFYDPWYLFSRFNDVSRSVDERPGLAGLRPARPGRTLRLAGSPWWPSGAPRSTPRSATAGRERWATAPCPSSASASCSRARSTTGWCRSAPWTATPPSPGRAPRRRSGRSSRRPSSFPIAPCPGSWASSSARTSGRTRSSATGRRRCPGSSGPARGRWRRTPP